MIESLSKFESCGIPFFRFRTLNLLSNFLDSRSFNFDDFASVVSRASVIQVKRWPGRFLTLYSLPCISYLVSVLQPISTNCFSVKDSFSFAEWAKQFTHNGEFMCSFDVSSLFTNVPLDETIEICLDKLYAFANPPRLPRLVLKNLLLFVTKKSHFSFKLANWEVQTETEST